MRAGGVARVHRWLDHHGLAADRAVTAINAELLGNSSWGIASVAHQALLAELDHVGPQVLAPRSELSTFDRLWNPTPYLLVTAIVPGSSKRWLVEIVQRPLSAPNVCRGYSVFLSQMCGFAESYFQSA